MPSKNNVSSSAKVAYLGPEGTFSHLIATRRFPKRAGLPVPTITEVFHAVRSGKAELGVVPIENSSGGTITETVDLLIESAGETFIAEELALDVRLALLGREGTSFDKLKSVYSHVMPLRHHRDWILENLPGVTMIESTSTAEAAKKASGSAVSAALAAPGAAKLYGRDVFPNVRASRCRRSRKCSMPFAQERPSSGSCRLRIPPEAPSRRLSIC